MKASSRPAGDGGELVREIPLRLVDERGGVRELRDQDLGELVASIARQSVIDPVILRPGGPKDRPFRVVTGHRRVRAAQLARQETVPAIVRKMNDREALEAEIAEQKLRRDLTPIEEGRLYRRYLEETKASEEQLADRTGVSQEQISNHVRLLHLPKGVQNLVQAGKLSFSHAKLILQIPKEAKDVRLRLAEDSVTKEWTTRELTNEVTKEIRNLKVSRQGLRRQGRGPRKGWPFKVYVVPAELQVLAATSSEAKTRSQELVDGLQHKDLVGRRVLEPRADFTLSARYSKKRLAEENGIPGRPGPATEVPT